MRHKYQNTITIGNITRSGSIRTRQHLLPVKPQTELKMSVVTGVVMVPI